MKMNRWNWTRRNERAGEAGQTTVFFVLILGIFLLGGLCLAFDLANMWFHRQAAQTAADAACTAGAMDLLVDAEGGATTHQGFTLGTPYNCSTTSTDSVCQYASKNGYDSNNAAPGNLVSVSFPAGVNGVTPPPVGLAATPFIRVDVLDHVSTFFVGLLSGGTTADVRAFATCGVETAKAPIPLVVLNPKVPAALGGGGTPTIKILGGPNQSIQVDSDSSGGGAKSANTAVSWGGTIDLSQGGPDYNGSSLGTWGGPATYSAGVGKAFLPADPAYWLDPSPPILDPFAQVDKPGVQPDPVPPGDLNLTNSCVFDGKAPGKCTGNLCTSADIKAGNCFVSHNTHGCPDPGATTPPLPKNGCQIYTAGNYPNGITLDSSGGVNAVAIFDPGVYYLTGGLGLKSNSVVRPGTGTGDGSKGTVFYLTGTAQKCSGQTGLVCVGSDSGKAGLDTFDIYAAQCPGGAAVDPKLIAALVKDGAAYTGLSGNLLLAPCTGTYGDPDGTGQYRGMLFFTDRSSNVGAGWGGGGGFLLAGSIYVHQCNAAGTGTGCGAPPTDFQAIFGLQGTSGSASYVLGQIVTDELAGGGTPTVYMVLNPSSVFTVLKASLFQ